MQFFEKSLFDVHEYHPTITSSNFGGGRGSHGYIYCVIPGKSGDHEAGRIKNGSGRSGFRAHCIHGWFRDHRFPAEFPEDKRGRNLIERLVVIAAFGRVNAGWASIITPAVPYQCMGGCKQVGQDLVRFLRKSYTPFISIVHKYNGLRILIICSRRQSLLYPTDRTSREGA